MDTIMEIFESLADFISSKKNTQNDDPTVKKARAKRRVRLSIFLVILFIVFITLIQNVIVVQADEYLIVRRFGEIVRVVNEPGLVLKTPFIENATTLPKQLLSYDVPPAEINTLDKKRIMVDYYAVWEITDPLKMIESLRTVSSAESRLGDIIYSHIRTELGRLNFSEIIGHRSGIEDKSARKDMDNIVKDQVNQRLLENGNGIKLVDIKMKRADLPSTNETSVFKRMISERESTAQQYLSQGDAEALKITANTDREYVEMLAKANSEASIIIAEGEKQAARIYNEAYGKDPEFFKLYTTLDSNRKTINGETVIILPQSSEYLKYILGK